MTTYNNYENLLKRLFILASNDFVLKDAIDNTAKYFIDITEILKKTGDEQIEILPNLDDIIILFLVRLKQEINNILWSLNDIKGNYQEHIEPLQKYLYHIFKSIKQLYIIKMSFKNNDIKQYIQLSSQYYIKKYLVKAWIKSDDVKIKEFPINILCDKMQNDSFKRRLIWKLKKRNYKNIK